MTTLLVSSAAAIAATALLGVLLVLALRGRGSEQRLTEAVARIDARLEAMVRDLSDALERAQEEQRRLQVLEDLGGSIDLDDVMTRTLEVARTLPNVDAAALSVESGEGAPLVAASGVDLDDGGRPSLALPPDGRVPRGVSITYAYGREKETAARGALVRQGYVVPLVTEESHVGYLAAYSRAGGLEEARGELESLAGRAAQALDNARRFQEARQLADLDALTGLHNRRFFHETLAREVARARRYERSLALVVLDIDDFKSINDRIGHLAGDDVLAEAAQRLRSAVRTADIACRVGGDEFAVILPESGLQEADQLYERVAEAMSAPPIGPAGLLRLSAGVAELREEDDTSTLFERADEALYRAKRAGKATVIAVPAPPEAERDQASGSSPETRRQSGG